MPVMPDRARPGELSVRTKASVRTVGGTKVYVTQTRALPVRIGKARASAASAGQGTPPTEGRPARKPGSKVKAKAALSKKPTKPTRAE